MTSLSDGNIWKDVVGYEGIYEVSDLGNVRSYHYNLYGPRLLKPKIGKDSCCRVSLWKDKKEKTWLVHRLVALAFLPIIEGKSYVNHKDGSRLNNHVDNLEWCNHTENNNHAFDNKLIKTAMETKLTDVKTGEVTTFRSMAKAGLFLNGDTRVVSGLLKKGITEFKGYEIEKIRRE